MKVFAITTIILTIANACHPSVSGVVANKQTAFQNDINSLRSQVATAQRENHEGQLSKAANMHFLNWNNGLAQQAQNCANKCPQYEQACSSGQNGMVQTWSTISSESEDWSPKNALNAIMADRHQSRQLVWANEKKFGCGRSVSKQGSTNVAYVVCFFDEGAKNDVQPYVESGNSAGGACKFGTVSGYPGLCAGGHHALLAKQHKIRHHKGKKHHNKHNKKHHHHQQN